MGACVRLTVPKQSSAFRLHLNEGVPRGCPLSLVLIVDDLLNSISSELADLLRSNEVPQE